MEYGLVLSQIHFDDLNRKKKRPKHHIRGGLLMNLEEVINKHFSKLNDTDLHIIHYIMNNKNSCYKMGINQLAQHCNVSRSSVLRLAKKLGFSGYSEFKIFLKWNHKATEEKFNYFDLLMKDMESNIKYLRAKRFDDICKLLETQSRIFVFGSGTAQTTCAYELQRNFINQHIFLNIIHDETEFEITLPDLTPNDVVIVISLSGDSLTFIPKIQQLVAKAIPIISITNLKTNTLAQMSTYNLYAYSKPVKANPVDIVSFVPFFLIGEALYRHYLDYREQQLSD